MVATKTRLVCLILAGHSGVDPGTSAGGYTDVNATTNDSTFYMQSGNLTTVVPENGLGEPQNYITDGGDKILILEQAKE